MSYKGGGIIPSYYGKEYAELDAILNIKGSLYQIMQYQKSANDLLQQIKKSYGIVDWEPGVNCVF